jgi:hypothetical protein
MEEAAMRHNPKRERVSKKHRPSVSLLERIQPDAAGIDCGQNSHFVAVPPDRDPQPVREFRTFTAELERLADWLAQCRIKTVAMESTGVYWIPLYEILEQRGLEVMLVNARDVHNVRGRKSDVMDCEWLRELHSVGLLRTSFRPAAALVPLRSFMRQRESLVEEASTRIHRMQKALTQMNVMLHVVVTDITGQTGLRIVRSILAGERDPERLAAHRDHRCHASHAEIVAALTGNYRAEHLFALRQNFAAYEFLLKQIAECDGEIEALLFKLADQQPPPTAPLPEARRLRHAGSGVPSGHPPSRSAARSTGSPAAPTSVKSTASDRMPRCNSLPRSGPTCAAGAPKNTLLPGWPWRRTTRSRADACSAHGRLPRPIAPQPFCAAAR